MKKILSFVAAMLVATAAVAATYYGWNPVSNLETTHGALVDGGTVQPVVSGTCGTRGTIVGGAHALDITSGAVTTCTTTLTFASAAPNGWNCRFDDLTTPASTVKQASYTTTSCTSQAATIVASDHLLVYAHGF